MALKSMEKALHYSPTDSSVIRGIIEVYLSMIQLI